MKEGRVYFIHPTRFSGPDRGSEKDWKKSPASCIRSASRNPNPDSIEEMDVKVLDRRKMIWVNGLLLALLVLSIVGCTLLGPVRLDLSQALRNIFSANPDAEILFRARLLAFSWESPSAAAWRLASCCKRCCAIRWPARR